MRFHRLVGAIALAAFTSTTTGCFGSFKLVQKVYALNQHVGNKWVQTVVFWVFCILPVYSLAAFADAIVFNLLEFWTGRNPLSDNETPSNQRLVDADGKQLQMSLLDDATLELRLTSSQGVQVYRLIATEQGGVLTDASGNVVTRTGVDDQGNLVVTDGQGEALMRRSADDVSSLMRSAEAGPAALLASSALRPCELAAR